MLEADLALKPTEDFADALEEACEEIASFFKGEDFDAFVEFDKAVAISREDASTFAKAVGQTKKMWVASKRDNEALMASMGKIGELAERGHDLARQIDHVSKLFARLVDTAESELNARNDEKWSWREIRTASKLIEERRVAATAQLNLIRYFTRHARWLQERFPDAKLCDVEGLVKLIFVDRAVEGWLTTIKYVGAQANLANFIADDRKQAETVPNAPEAALLKSIFDEHRRGDAKSARGSRRFRSPDPAALVQRPLHRQ
jgi:type I restriction enzyme M protein